MLNEYLNRKVHVVVDRPLGSRLPEHPDLIHLLNCGFIPNSDGGDDEEIDAYIVGEFTPLTEYDGIVIAVIHRLTDKKDKLVVAGRQGLYHADQILALTEFQERFFDCAVIT